MKKEYLDYVEDIVRAMDDVSNFVEGLTFEVFASDKKSVYAVIRAIEIIGEATKNIPLDIRNQYPQIPFKEMAGMRDKVIHEYSGVDLKRVWKTVNSDIPELKPLFEKILVEKSKK